MLYVAKFFIIIVCIIISRKLSDSYLSGLITGFIIDGILSIIDATNDIDEIEEIDTTDNAPEIESLKTEIKNLKLEKDQLNRTIKDLNQDLEVADDKVKLSNRAIQMAEDKFQALNKDYNKLEHENNRIWKLFEDERNRK